MRLLHLSDLHIGKRVNEFSLLDDQRFVLESALETIRERSVDALLVAGDLYDKASPSSEAVRVFDWFLEAVAETGAAVFAVSGNHDAAERIAYASSLLARQRVFLSPVFNGSVASYDMEDAYGPVTFWLLPFLRPPTVREHFPNVPVKDYTDALACVVASCGVDPERRNVALAHQFVTCGGRAPSLGGSELSVGGLDNVDARVFDPFDYVALGHVHRPQQVGRPTVRYSGSPLKYSFGEARDVKSAPLVELGPKGSVDVELVRLRTLHDLREVKGTLEALLSTEAIRAADPDDYLHVVLTDENPAPDALGRLRAFYPNIMALDFDNTRTRRAGSMPELDDSDLAKDTLELFEAFYEHQNGAPLSEGQRSVCREELEKSREM